MQGRSAWSGTLLFLSMFFVAGLSSPVHSEIIFSDDFSGGGLSKSMNGAQWTSQVSVSVVPSPSFVGTNSAEFSYKGSSDLSSDAFSELRFDLGRVYPEVWMDLHIYIPSNYEHRNASGTDNNKFLRMWGATYNDGEKLGLSFWPSGSAVSTMIADWSRPGEGIGPKGESYSSFITQSDKGKWMNVRVQVVAAQSSSTPGSLRVWKNGNLVIDNSGIVSNYRSGEPHGYRYGYLLGWSNSGFNTTTKFNIDGVVFATSAADLDAGGSGVAPPNPPVITVE